MSLSSAGLEEGSVHPLHSAWRRLSRNCKLIVFGEMHRRLLHDKETQKSRMAVASFPIKKKIIIKLLLAAFNNFVQLQLQLLED